MTEQKLKRIKVSSELELRNWLARNSGRQQKVMIVTCNKKSAGKQISSSQVREVLRDTEWFAHHTQTLPGNLLGHVVSHR